MNKLLEVNNQEIEYLQSLFVDMLQSKTIKSQYEIKRLEIFLDKLAKL